jgi:HAD superfamily hydrolase (TIGR01509 family)
MKISAVIFDFDGTVVDSENEWGMAFTDVLKSLGYESLDKHPETTGVSLKKSWEILINKLNIKTDKDLGSLETLTYNNYLNHLDSVSLKPGVTEFIEKLKDSGVKTALATSTNWSIADRIMENLGIKDFFDVLTTGEEVMNQKPDPDILLITAEKLEEKEENCLVIEDSPSGVEAAHRAGMKVVAILSEEEDQKDLSGADCVVESFAEITPKMIEEL